MCHFRVGKTAPLLNPAQPEPASVMDAAMLKAYKICQFLPLLLLLILAGCAAAPTTVVEEGVEFLDDDRVAARFCSRVSIETGRKEARRQLRMMALNESLAAYKTTIQSVFQQKTACQGVHCQEQAASFIQQVSEAAISRLQSRYFDASDGRLCIAATIDFEEPMSEVARMLGLEPSSVPVQPRPTPTTKPVIRLAPPQPEPEEKVRSCELLGLC